MNKSFVLLFSIKVLKKNPNGTVPIYLRITVDSTRAEIATKRHVLSEKWNHAAQKVIGNSEEARALNAYLKSLEQQVYNAHKELMETKMPLTAHNHKRKIFGESKEIISLIDVFKDHAFITSFDFYLRSVRNCNNNSTFKYVKNFKKIIGICMANGWLTNNPFIKYKIKIKEVERQVLTQEELQRLSSKVFTNTRLNNTRDVFLFCCYTGLAYIDVKKLQRSMICTGIDGEKWIFTHRQKSKEPSRVPLLPMALVILEKYESNVKCKIEDLTLPHNVHHLYILGLFCSRIVVELASIDAAQITLFTDDLSCKKEDTPK